MFAFMGPMPAYRPERPEIPRGNGRPLEKGSLFERFIFAVILIALIVTWPIWLVIAHAIFRQPNDEK